MKRIVYGCLLAVLSLCAVAAPLVKRKLMADKTLSTVSYSAKHPLHEWGGVSHAVNCAVTYNDDTKQVENVAVSIKVATFDSGNSNRDSHAMEVLDGLKYPNVTFVSSDVKTGTDGGLTATGNLTFHGVTKPVTLQAMRKDAGGKMTLTGEFPVSMTAYSIERPSFLGVKTEDAMTLKFVAVFAL
jgi:polyisoprenoid-binding protein YceI